MKKPSLCLSREQIEERLREKGLTPTLQRVGICQYVLCEADHPSAEDVQNWAQANLGKISLATVYNTLGSLVDVGLLREFRFPHLEKAVYDNNIEEHHHFFDETSGRVLDIPAEALDLKTSLGKDFQVSGYEILLKGTLKNTNKQRSTT